MAIDAGIQGLTVHPRPDQRHIRPGDVDSLAQLSSPLDHVEFNVEGNPFAQMDESYPGFIEIIARVRPTQCTLVPDSNHQKTSDHGFDLHKDFDSLQPIVERLKALGSRVSLFMDPDPQQIALAAKLGADRIELYTGPFALAYEQDRALADNIFAQHCQAAQTALDLGIGVNAGHDLNLVNMQLYKTLPGLQEVSIGHALTVDSLLMGFNNAIKEYLDVCA